MPASTTIEYVANAQYVGKGSRFIIKPNDTFTVTTMFYDGTINVFHEERTAIITSSFLQLCTKI